jgi:transketolase
MRNRFADLIYNYGKKDKKICVLVADISPAGSINQFRKKYSNRFINTGVSEQSMIGIAAGLSLKGMKPFCYTIATFAFYRPFEIIRVDLCYQNLPVTIVGMGTGSVYTTLGSTHLTIEDISVARSLPNLKIISPCDPFELEKAIIYCIQNKESPVYLRIGKTGEQDFNYPNSEAWQFGKVRRIKNGSKICILTYGPIIKNAFLISDFLIKKHKLNISVYSFHTLKPIDYKGLKKIFNKYNKVVIIEDNSWIGGLSTIVKTFAFEEKYDGLISSFSLQDKFIHFYGDQTEFLKKHGISSKKIITDILKT